MVEGNKKVTSSVRTAMTLTASMTTVATPALQKVARPAGAMLHAMPGTEDGPQSLCST